MIKLADEPRGSVTGPRIHKTLTNLDRRRLAEGVTLATEILGERLRGRPSLFSESLGNPPILTIVAMAKRIGRLLTMPSLPGDRPPRSECGEGMRRTLIGQLVGATGL